MFPMFAVRVSILSYLCYFHLFPIFFLLSFLSFFFFLFVFFFITPYFILLALSLAFAQGLHLEESSEVTWEQHSSAKGGERRGASTLRSCSASSRVVTRVGLASLAIKPGFLMIAAEEKKFSDHSNHMETGLKLESLLAAYSFPPRLPRYCDGQVYHIWQ